jgi:hypothetical protein
MSDYLTSKAILKLGLLSKIGPLRNVILNGRMKPSFFIVGFQKCGTTSLYETICSHPNVLPGMVKENDILAEPKDRLDEFRMCFPPKSGSKITGDASHLHTWMPYGLDRIKNHFPDFKLIVIMRNPIDRALSHFNMEKNFGYVPNSMSFEAYVDIELKLRNTIEIQDDPDEIYNGMRLYRNKFGWAVSRGVYSIYLKKMKRLGLDFHPVFLENLFSNPQVEWESICQLLNLDVTQANLKHSNIGSYTDSLDGSVLEKLKDFYAQPNQELSEMLNCKIPWN